ncbi:MAG: glycosyltransferase [bacterium]
MYVAIIIAGMLLISSYVILISLFITGWKKNRTYHSVPKPSGLWASVVVAVRNEEKNILTLLHCLHAQRYPDDHYEVIIIDDFSSDQTPVLVNNFIADKDNFHLILSRSADTKGKKAALERGIAKARGDIIVTTDADCRMEKDWLTTLLLPFVNSDTKLVIGPVTIEDGTRRLYSRLQTLEFMSLTGTAAGAAGCNHPIMCNGANLAFVKEARKKVIHQVAGMQQASGDDVFLLHAFKRRYGTRIRFIKNTHALVYTNPARTLREFFSQRVRWAGKSAAYNDRFTQMTGAVVAGLNIFIALGGIASIGWPVLLPALLGILFLKLFIDSILLFQVARFLSRKMLLLWYPLLAIVYPYYVTSTILLALTTSTHWKKRIV